jgi:UPF0755 protein
MPVWRPARGSRPGLQWFWGWSPLVRSLVCSVAGAVVLGGLGLALATAPLKVGSTEKVTFEVRHGEGVSSIAGGLERAGIIRDRLTFRVLCALAGWDGKLKSGRYEMGPGYSTWGVLRKIGRGQVITVAVTIPEGFTLAEIEALVVEKGWTSGEAFRKVLRDLDASGDLPFLPVKRTGFIQPYEGLLSPNTYFFEEAADPETIAQTMVRATASIFTPERLARAKELGLTPFEVLTLASIIEKETGAAEERAIIASVYHNRLHIGMKLDACPTVFYVVGKSADEPLLYRDLEVDSPYNSYLNAGLPPGPICSPGLAAILAALYPADTDFFYFVSKNDGTHQFSHTLDEHNRAVQKYQGGGG